MHIIGMSGLHNSVPFKRQEIPGLSSRQYRIAQGLDSAAALVNPSGVVAAAAEERFTGEKATGSFPIGAIDFCLRQGGLRIEDVDLLAHGFAYQPSELHERNEYTRRRFRQVYSVQALLEVLDDTYPRRNWPDRVVQVPHHVAHAASSYHLSGFDRALLLVADGMGETESMTVAIGAGHNIEVIRTVPALHSLGILYGIFTLYLGFRMAIDEYKVMGLAPFGDPRRYFDEIMNMIQLGRDGHFVIPVLAADRSLHQQETHEGVLGVLAERLGPPRAPDAAIEKRHRDVAAALQAGLEACVLHVLRYFRLHTGLRKLGLAGGVALNCSMNGLIARSCMFDDIFVQPAAGDDGSALGAALHLRAQHLPRRPLPALAMPYFGPEYDDEDVAQLLSTRSDCASQRWDSFDELAAEVARLIDDGRVVAWFQGRMEFGPRALGNRSILADPRPAGMRDRLNEMVKRREDFRPFAPAVTQEAADRYFDVPEGTGALYRHMLFVTRTRREHRARLAAVTHVDGTARLQIVRRADNERFWQLLKAFGQRTGVPVLLNTSFNLRGQPIIRDPRTAVETYVASALDHLVIGTRLISRARAVFDVVDDGQRSDHATHG